MPNTQAGIGAQRYTKFLNSDAGAPFRTRNQWYTNYLNPDKTSSKTPVVTHNFGTSAYNYKDALKSANQAIKNGQQWNLSGATKEQKNELNRRYLESLKPKPVVKADSAYENTIRELAASTYTGLPNTTNSITTRFGGGSIYSSVPTMR